MEAEEIQGTDSSIPETVTDSGSVDSSTTEVTPVQEAMVPQSKVDKIIGHVRSDAEKKAYARAQKEFDAKSVGGMKQPNSEEINRMIDERVEQRAQQAFAQQLVQDFTQKIKAGSAKFQDFDDVVSDLNLASNPHLVRWANGLDNTADVLYDLGKNPEKYASVMMLANTSPNMALKKLQQLSDSIKRNEQAKGAETAEEPIDHLKPTTNGLDSGSMTVKDLQQLDWLRG